MCLWVWVDADCWGRMERHSEVWQRTSISWLILAGLKLVPKRSARPRFFVFALSSSWSKLIPVMPSIVL